MPYQVCACKLTRMRSPVLLKHYTGELGVIKYLPLYIRVHYWLFSFKAGNMALYSMSVKKYHRDRPPVLLTSLYFRMLLSWKVHSCSKKIKTEGGR